MDKFIRRLKYYGIGFGIGIVFVFIFFQNRGCSWLPSNRVKNAILDRVIVIPDQTDEELKNLGLTEQEIIEVLNDGEVLFDESKKEGNPKVYLLEKDGKKYAFTLPSESFISEIFVVNSAKSIKNSINGTGRLLHFPADENLIFVDSSAHVTCQQNALRLINPQDILKGLKKSGKIDFSKTKFKLTPKPEHRLVFSHEKGLIGTNVVWYKNKLNITSFDLSGDDPCID